MCVVAVDGKTEEEEEKRKKEGKKARTYHLSRETKKGSGLWRRTAVVVDSRVYVGVAGTRFWSFEFLKREQKHQKSDFPFMKAN